ncbi:MAG: LEA type 2 family protein [Candidatus Aminicenantales bacterium]
MRKRRRKQKFRALFLLLFFLAASTNISARPLSKIIQVSLRERKVQDLSFSGLELVFYVNIANTSNRPVYLFRYDYRFEVNDQEYLKVIEDVDGALKIDPKKTTVISLPIRITYQNLFQAVEGIEGEDRAVCYLNGGLTFTDGKKQFERFPVAFSADFPLLKQPEIEFLSFQIKNLTIGGADVMFEVLFKNRNNFELLVDRLNYRIELGGSLLDEGTVSGNKNIEGKGSRRFSFPMLFNFFEVGSEVYDKLRQQSSECRFSGEAEVMTAWGRVRIPFEKSGLIFFSRAS